MRIPGFSAWHMSTKLLFTNLLVFGFIIAMMVVMFYSSQAIEQKMTRIVQQDVPQVIDNASIGRTLVEVFADTSDLLDRFLDEQELLQHEGERLQHTLTAVIARTTTTPELTTVLTQFREAFQALLEQGEVVKQQSDDVHLLESEMESNLKTLEEQVANDMIVLKMDNGDIRKLEQIAIEIPWYRETRLQMKVSLLTLIQAYLRSNLADDSGETDQTLLQILLLVDEFDARLQPLTAAESKTLEFGETLIEQVSAYKTNIVTLSQELTAFQTKLKTLNALQTQILALMETNDQQIGQATGTIQAEIAKVLHSSRMVMLGFSGVIIVVMATGWLGMRWMIHPLFTLARIAEQLAEGDLECQPDSLARSTAGDEIGILSQSFIKLLNYMQTMATTATDIAQGKISHVLHARSSRDVLGSAFQNMSTYLQEMAAMATAIAQGDLRQTIQPKNEHDVLGQAFQQMGYFRQLISDIRASALKLNTAAENLTQISTLIASSIDETSAQTQLVSVGSQQISENVNAVATSTREISANIHEISHNTDNVAHIASNAAELVTSATQIITELEDRSQEISQIIKMITAVTQQTNLLALNATIEAVRAGDAGRGFVVVASEIKQLSRETAASAERIIQQLEALRSGSSGAMNAIEKVAVIITQIRDLSVATASGVEEQSATTQEMVQRMTEAALGSQGISKSLTEVAAAIHQASSGTEDARHAAEGLAALSENLQQLVAKIIV